MRKVIPARDLLPIEDLDGDERTWLGDLQLHVDTSKHVVPLAAVRDEHEPIVWCGADGTWRAGRYIGSVAFRGHRIEISPRFNLEILAGWLGALSNLVLVPDTSMLRESEALIPTLLAIMWCRELDSASRHGLPFLRAARETEGLLVRGRLDPSRTLTLRRQGRRAVASISHQRSLDNDIARTAVCAQRALRQLIGHDRWMTARARSLMPHLWGAVGTRPRLPDRASLRRIRYSPIRYPFRGFVERSWRVAQLGGYTSSHEEGRAEGVLLDVAELWEHLVLNAVRRVTPRDDVVEHGSDPTASREHLFESVEQPAEQMGRLKPDVTVRRQGRVIAVIDAKYKLLANRADAPDGVERSDRYQLASYLAALGGDAGALGVLAYPAEADESGDPLPREAWRESRAEALSPWTIREGDSAVFSRFSPTLEECASELHAVLRSS